MSATPASSSVLAVIPARYGSTRFPGKPLAKRTGTPLIQHVIERVRQARHIADVIVATDDQRIADAVAACGSRAMMTRSDHPNGTSRIAEVAQRLLTDTDAQPHLGPDDVVVNVQGDEPEIEPAVIDQLVDGLAHDPDAPMATLASPFAPDEDPADPNIVKLVVDQHNRALYFSRALIPFVRDSVHPPSAIRHPPLKHPGLYAYRCRFLLRYVTLPPTPLEQAEKLEQLRALEHGYPIAVVRAVVHHHGIDTPEQYDDFVRRWQADARGSAG